MKKVIGLLFVLTGLFGLFMAMNEDADHINFVGVLIFGLSCFFGAKHAKDEFHPLLFIQDKWYYYKHYLIFWRI